MTIKKAIDHFNFKFDKVWKPTQYDVDALITIIEFVEDKHKKQIQDYHLFAKLYIVVYAQYLDRYKTTVFDDIPKKELNKLLDKPLDFFLNLFTQRLNESELYSLFDELNINMDHPALKSDKIKDKETNKLHNALNDKENIKRFRGEIWKKEVVQEKLELDINNLINKHG